VAAGKGKGGGAGAVAQGGTLQERHFMGNINMFVLWHLQYTTLFTITCGSQENNVNYVKKYTQNKQRIMQTIIQN